MEGRLAVDDVAKEREVYRYEAEDSVKFTQAKMKLRYNVRHTHWQPVTGELAIREETLDDSRSEDDTEYD